jgi:hypothetical protein
MNPKWSRLEDRICDLCQKLIESDNDTEFESVAADLRRALREHIERTRRRLGVFPNLTESRPIRKSEV